MKTAIDNGDRGDNDGDQQHNHYQQVSPSITEQWGSMAINIYIYNIRIYGGFLKLNRGTPSYHPFYSRIFHEINHPAIVLGYPHLQKPQYVIQVCIYYPLVI